MTIAGGIVSYAVMWFVILLVVLPRGVATQAEVDRIEPGTPPGAPDAISIRRKALYTTVITLIPWGIFASIIHFELLTLADFAFLFPDSFRETVRP